MLMWDKRCRFVFSYRFSRLHSSSSPWLINSTSGAKCSFDPFTLQTIKSISSLGHLWKPWPLRFIRSLVEFGCSYNCVWTRNRCWHGVVRGGKKRWKPVFTPPLRWERGGGVCGLTVKHPAKTVSSGSRMESQSPAQSSRFRLGMLGITHVLSRERSCCSQIL